MWSKDVGRHGTVVGALLAIVIAGLGCEKSDAGDLEVPESAPVQPPASVQPALLGLPTFVQYTSPISLKTSTALVGPLGGTVQAGHFTLTVPAGALAIPVPIVVSEINLLVEQCSIEPTGLRFAEPARLTVSYAGTSADLSSSTNSGLAVWWLNPDLSKWVSLGGTVNNTTKTVSVSLNHLSYYALAR